MFEHIGVMLEDIQALFKDNVSMFDDIDLMLKDIASLSLDIEPLCDKTGVLM
jgi:hypothetical protein